MSHFVISKIQTARQQQHSKYSQYLPVQCTELWRHQAKHSADLTWINSVHLKVGCGNLRKFKLGKASSSISSLTTKSGCLRGFKPSPLFNGHLLQETGRLASLVSLESFLCPGGGLSHRVWGWSFCWVSGSLSGGCGTEIQWRAEREGARGPGHAVGLYLEVGVQSKDVLKGSSARG